MYGLTGDMCQKIIFATNLYFAKFIALEIIALGMPKNKIYTYSYLYMDYMYLCVCI